MKNILLIWLAGFFMAGLILGIVSISVSPNLVTFSQVHDLFEIFGAVATVLAVGIALYGLNTWQTEIGAASDHELARRLAVSLRRYKLSVVDAWHCAESCSVQLKHQSWIGPGGRKNILVEIHEKKIKALQDARLDLDCVALEASVIWGGVFDTGFHQLYQLEKNCSRCIDSYLYLLVRGTADDQAFTQSDSALDQWQKFRENGVTDDRSIKALFDSYSHPLEIEIRQKLLKGRTGKLR